MQHALPLRLRIQSPYGFDKRAEIVRLSYKNRSKHMPVFQLHTPDGLSWNHASLMRKWMVEYVAFTAGLTGKCIQTCSPSIYKFCDFEYPRDSNQWYSMQQFFLVKISFL